MGQKCWTGIKEIIPEHQWMTVSSLRSLVPTFIHSCKDNLWGLRALPSDTWAQQFSLVSTVPWKNEPWLKYGGKELLLCQLWQSVWWISSCEAVLTQKMTESDDSTSIMVSLAYIHVTAPCSCWCFCLQLKLDFFKPETQSFLTWTLTRKFI